jgi:hypothetical protein
MNAFRSEFARFADVDQQNPVAIEGGLDLLGGEVVGFGSAEHFRFLPGCGGPGRSNCLDRAGTAKFS